MDIEMCKRAHEIAESKGAALPLEWRERLEKAILATFEGESIYEAFGISQEAMDALYQHAYEFYQASQFEKAFSCLAILMKFDQASYRYAFAAAASQQALGHFAPAAGLYERCSVIDPLLPDPHFYMYNCFLNLGEHAVAESELDKVLHLTEGREEEWYQLMRARAMFEKL